MTYDQDVGPFFRLLTFLPLLLSFDPLTLRTRTEDPEVEAALGKSWVGYILAVVLLMFDPRVAIRRCKAYPWVRYLTHGYIVTGIAFFVLHLVLLGLKSCGL